MHTATSNAEHARVQELTAKVSGITTTDYDGEVVEEFAKPLKQTLS